MAHYVEVSDEVWDELTRVQKHFGLGKNGKNRIIDDVVALAGDLDAIYEDEPTATQPKPVEPKETSTRAAVLEVSPAELDDILGDVQTAADEAADEEHHAEDLDDLL